MHTYTEAQGLPPSRVAPLSRADLVRLTDIYDAYKRRDLYDGFGKEDDDYDYYVDNEGGLFPMI